MAFTKYVDKIKRSYATEKISLAQKFQFFSFLRVAKLYTENSQYLVTRIVAK